MTLLENQIANRKLVLEFGLPLLLLVVSCTAYYVSARALKPIREMIQKAHAIAPNNLSERLPIPIAADEVKELAETLNQMMRRIESAFQSQERFIADASHQLLTPLTILKGELESALRGTSPLSTESLLQETDRLTKLVQDLLVLARVDAGVGALLMKPLYLEEIVLEAISKIEKIARPRGIRLSFNILGDSSGVQVMGEEDLLSHLVLNLLENAVKYSPDSSQVQITLQQAPQTQQLSIEDQGPGIAPEELKIIFERFHRGLPKSGQQRPGYGLGLAIARQIARAHGARLWAENRMPSSVNPTGALFHFDIKNL